MVLAAMLAGIGLAGCDRESRGPSSASNTAVLGSPASAPRAVEPPPVLRDPSGQSVTLPLIPAGVAAQAAFTAPDIAWAVWVQEGRAVGARYTGGAWEAPIPFERIAGTDSDVQLATNGQGTALALWRHTVGKIESLRYSRWEAATGWSGPDVLHGALPQARPPGLEPGQPHAATAPKLTMDASGTAYAEWPSGFDPGQVQSAMNLRRQGWTRPADRAVAAR